MTGTAPKIFVTGATGNLGGRVIDTLLGTMAPDGIVAGVRGGQENTGAIEALREKGVEPRIADYDRPDTLAAAFRGIDRLLLVSSSEPGKRTGQHRNVIDAAAKAGVGLIAYTSILHADRSPLALAAEHRDTEAALAASGVPFTLLRNAWYTEVLTWRLPLAIRLGVYMGAAGSGRISSAARADYADAAAAVLAGEGHAGQTYELAGDTAFALEKFVSVASDALGTALSYRDMSPAALRSTLVDAGQPEASARSLAETDAFVAGGAMTEEGRTLSRLIGRPTTPIENTLRDYAQERLDHP